MILSEKVKFNLTAVSVSLFLSLTSCESDLELDRPALSPLLTVGCILKADEPVILNLTKSLPYPNNSDTTVLIRNASVIIYSKEVTPDTLTYKELKYGNLINGSYISENGLIPFSGSSYQIKIKVPGFNDLSSQTLIPQPVPILAVDTNTIFIKNGDRNEKVIECTIKFQDPPDKNYYKLSIDRTGLFYFCPDGPYNCTNITSKHLASFYCHDINVIYRKINQNSPGSIQSESEDQEISTTEVFLSDVSFNGKTYELKVLLNLSFLFDITNQPPGESTNRKINFRLYSINEEYYKYSNSYFNQLFNKNNMFSEPIQVYSNISNGIGIFSGASVSIDSSLVMPIKYNPIYF